ncbi:MAG TPA: type I methionyl aminopeptidase [Terriglobales bacterium]|nr:type I methionyl aminopeptidase [Terriglobales bacterium]
MGSGEDRIIRKSPAEIEKMRRSGQMVRQVLNHVKSVVAPGATTMDLESTAAKLIQELGAMPAFKGYYGYPCVLCTSVNEEIVHGIPSEKRVLKTGDIVSIDCGVVFDGYYGDAAITVPVGDSLTPELKKLLEVTEASLYKGIEQVKIGNTIGHVGSAIQKHVEAAGFSVVREFVGHGIGTKLHEAPQIPNFGKKGQGPELSEGMVLAIEPMVNSGGPGTKVLSDKWTAVTLDGSYSAHFEHCVAVTKQGPVILTN